MNDNKTPGLLALEEAARAQRAADNKTNVTSRARKLAIIGMPSVASIVVAKARAMGFETLREESAKRELEGASDAAGLLPPAGPSFMQTEQPEKIKRGTLIVATRYARVERTIYIVYGYYGEFVNNIVTIETTAGKTLHLFQSDNYRWIVKPARSRPGFSTDPPQYRYVWRHTI